MHQKTWMFCFGFLAVFFLQKKNNKQVKLISVCVCVCEREKNEQVGNRTKSLNVLVVDKKKTKFCQRGGAHLSLSLPSLLLEFTLMQLFTHTCNSINSANKIPKKSYRQIPAILFKSCLSTFY